MTTTFIYFYRWKEDEHELCRLEMRAFFGSDCCANVLISHQAIEVNRSPFMRARLDVLFQTDHVEELLRFAECINMGGRTYKVHCMHDTDVHHTTKWSRAKRQQLEREIGLVIDGEPDLNAPQVVFGVVCLNDTWYFGTLELGEAIWLRHQQKPQSYSTALSTRVARAIVNIAVPHKIGIRAVDPCCGIGTVLIEALSMGIDIEGRDISLFVCVGARKNIAHFGYTGTVTLGPIEAVTEQYDVAIIDMPYNVFTHSDASSQRSIIQSARRIATKTVFVTIDAIDDMLDEVGFYIQDRCTVKKHHFVRHVLVCI